MNNYVVFWGYTAEKNKIMLGVPKKFSIKMDVGGAHLLNAEFACPIENICTLWGEYKGKKIFDGIADEQITTVSGTGASVKIIARDKKALLIDNQAMPGNIRNPSLRLISHLYLEPLGFKVVTGDFTPKSGTVNVAKGTSIMSLLNTFCKKYLNSTAVIDDELNVYCGRYENCDYLYFDKFISYSSAENNYKIISDIYSRNSVAGGYSSHWKNPNSKGIIRKKYVDKGEATNFNRDKTVAFTMAGIMPIKLYDIAETSFGASGTVKGIRYYSDDGGYKTEVILSVSAI